MSYETYYAGELEPTHPISEELKEKFSQGYEFYEPENKTLTEEYNKLLDNSKYCTWRVNDEGNLEAENGGSSSYAPERVIDWLKYLIKEVFANNPLNGIIEWEGDDWGDRGAIKITNNQIQMGHYELVFNPLERKAIAQVIHGGPCADTENRGYCSENHLKQAESIISYLKDEQPIILCSNCGKSITRAEACEIELCPNCGMCDECFANHQNQPNSNQ